MDEKRTVLFVDDEVRLLRSIEQYNREAQRDRLVAQAAGATASS